MSHSNLNPAVVAALLILVLGLNLPATVMLMRSDFESRFQKVAQLLIVWGLPLVGAITVIAILKQSMGVRRGQESSDSVDGSWPSGAQNSFSRSEGDPWGHGHGDGGLGHGGDGGHV